jgi:hypothetical protein
MQAIKIVERIRIVLTPFNSINTTNIIFPNLVYNPSPGLQHWGGAVLRKWDPGDGIYISCYGYTICHYRQLVEIPIISRHQIFKTLRTVNCFL